MFCRFGVNRSRTDSQRFGILVILINKSVGKFLYSNAFFIGSSDHFVIDICEILDKSNLITFPLQLPSQHVKRDERPGIADMEIIIHSRAARIDTHFSIMDRLKSFFFTGHAVIDLHNDYLLYFFLIKSLSSTTAQAKAAAAVIIQMIVLISYGM